MCGYISQGGPFYSHIGGWSPYWVHSARRPLNDLLYLPRAIVVMKNLVEWRLAGETEVLGENWAPVPLCPPQIPLDQTRARTLAAAVGSQRLTAGAMARPGSPLKCRSASYFENGNRKFLRNFGKIYRTSRSHVPENNDLHSSRHKNFKPRCSLPCSLKRGWEKWRESTKGQHIWRGGGIQNSLLLSGFPRSTRSPFK
jgi:hypothetical protein